MAIPQEEENRLELQKAIRRQMGLIPEQMEQPQPQLNPLPEAPIESPQQKAAKILLESPEIQKTVPVKEIPPRRLEILNPFLQEAVKELERPQQETTNLQNSLKTIVKASEEELGLRPKDVKKVESRFPTGQEPISDILEKAYNRLKGQQESLDKAYEKSEEEGRKKLKQINEEMAKPKEMGLPEIFARLAIGLGPALVGQAISQAGGYGSIGGAAGGAAGVSALQELNKTQEEQQKRQQEAIKTYYSSLSEQEKRKLEKIAAEREDVRKRLADLDLLQPKMELEARRDIAKYLAEAETKKFLDKPESERRQILIDRIIPQINTTVKDATERAKAISDVYKSAGLKQMEEGAKEKEKPKPFALGFGIVPRPDVEAKDITPEMTKKAQEITSDYGALKASTDRLAKLAQQGAIKANVPFSQQRSDVQNALTDLMVKIKNNYVKAGAALSESELILVEGLKPDPNKSAQEMARSVVIPDNFLRLVQRASDMFSSDVAAKVYPYGYRMAGQIGGAKVAPKPTAKRMKSDQELNKMSEEELKKYINSLKSGR